MAMKRAWNHSCEGRAAQSGLETSTSVYQQRVLSVLPGGSFSFFPRSQFQKASSEPEAWAHRGTKGVFVVRYFDVFERELKGDKGERHQGESWGYISGIPAGMVGMSGKNCKGIHENTGHFVNMYIYIYTYRGWGSDSLMPLHATAANPRLANLCRWIQSMFASVQRDLCNFAGLTDFAVDLPGL